MATINYKYDNLFNSRDVVLCHCISNDKAMGAGIAKQFVTRFPELKPTLLSYQTKVGMAVPVHLSKDRTVFNLITKEKYWQKPIYQTMEMALINLKAYVIRYNIKTLSMPRIGAGLDRLEWSKVEEIINRVFKDVDVFITVFMPNKNNKGGDRMLKIYVDGSYTTKNPEFAGWGFVAVKSNNVVAKYNGKIKATMRNVTGEIVAVIHALNWAYKNGYKDIEILYDYQGIGAWIDGSWKAKNEYTQKYVQSVKNAQKVMNISFAKVKGHSGVKFNEVADKLAKEALSV